jgi:hypothetical protein
MTHSMPGRSLQEESLTTRTLKMGFGVLGQVGTLFLVLEKVTYNVNV